jgi:hypothetical protein
MERRSLGTRPLRLSASVVIFPLPETATSGDGAGLLGDRVIRPARRPAPASVCLYTITFSKPLWLSYPKTAVFALCVKRHCRPEPGRF